MSSYLPFTTTSNTNNENQNVVSSQPQPVVDDKEVERISKCQEECKKPRTKFLGIFGGKKSKNTKSNKKSKKNNKSRKNGKSRKNRK